MANQLNPGSKIINTNLDNTKVGSDNLQTKTGNQNSTVLKILIGIAGIFLIICGLVIFGVVYKFATPYFGPKTQIVLEPDYSLVSTVDPADLKTAVEILNARARSLGYSSVSFGVSENNQIVAQVPKSVNVEELAGNTIAIGLLEFIDLGTTLLPERTIIATDFDYKYFPQVEGTKWHTVMTNSEFESVYVKQDQFGKYSISFMLTPNGTKTLSEYTTNNVGHYLGIVLDKVLVSAPMVNSPITTGEGVISGNFTKEQAESLAVYLKIKGPLPIPLKIKQVTTNSE